MSRIAVIDLGTNTFNLLIGEIIEDTFNQVFETKVPVKLGEGGINQQIIQPIPFARGINALKDFKKITTENRVEEVYLLATSAIRNAINGQEFVCRVKKELDWDIVIIDGDKEAELIYLGVNDALDLGEDPKLIMDIGGGSVEFIIANRNKIFWKKSYELGAARLLEKFLPSEPISKDEINTIMNFLDTQLQDLTIKANEFSINTLIGSSGSFDSFADVILNRFHGLESCKNMRQMTFNNSEFEEVMEIFIRSNRREREQIKGLAPMRVDMIVIASLLIKYVYDKLRIHTIRLSEYSLKEGVINAIKNKKLVNYV